MSKKLSEMTLEELWQLFPIQLVEHREIWKEYYREEKANIISIIGDGFNIYHIGSTSIDSIMAKPIVDILIEMNRKISMKKVADRLAENGYLIMSEDENRISLNKGYTENGFAEKVFHVHLRYTDDKDEIYFCEYLRQNENAAREYEALKIDLWHRYEHDRDAYTESKTELIRKYTEIAKEEVYRLVIFSDEANRENAEKLKSRLNCPVAYNEEDVKDYQIVLKYENDTLSLVSRELVLCADFEKLLNRIKPKNLKEELLIKASSLKIRKRIEVVDATAGLGEDSFLLAASGCLVKMYEYNPVIAALLRNGLERARKSDRLKDIVSEMQLYEEDSIEVLKKLNGEADIIYLDPMFPEKQKSSLIKKKMQLMHLLEKPCDDEKAMLDAALESGALRVVVKRPLKADYLDGRKPSYSLRGKAIRYDCYINN